MGRLIRIGWVVVALGCSGPAKPGDAGTGGSGGSGGGNGGSGGSGGSGGGVNNDDQCDFGGPRNCLAGSACTIAQLSDGGSAKRCIAGECDLIDQNCDAGLKCSFLDGGRACVPNGSLTEGQVCAGAPVGCGRGLACTFVATDAGSACARFCRLDGDCGSPQQCYVTLVLPETSERPLVCSDPPMSCSPLMQDCPGANDGCYPGSSGPGCFPAGTVDAGDSCTFSNDCMKGSACVGSTSKCRALCQFPTGAPACATGTCTRLSTSQNVGVCL